MLREVQPEDQAFVFEGLSHPDVIHHYGVRYDTFEAAKEQMDWYESIWKEGTGISWIIMEKETGDRIGDVCVYNYKKEHHKAEVGIWLLPQFWKKGYASEALSASVTYWQKEKRLHRMEAFVEEGNEASARLFAKAGFVYEGTMKDCERKNGRYISLKIYGRIME